MRPGDFPFLDLKSSYRNGRWEQGYGTCEALFGDNLNQLRKQVKNVKPGEKIIIILVLFYLF